MCKTEHTAVENLGQSSPRKTHCHAGTGNSPDVMSYTGTGGHYKGAVRQATREDHRPILKKLDFLNHDIVVYAMKTLVYLYIVG